MNPEVLGTIAAVLSVLYMALGLPFQINGIWKAKSTEGVSLFAMILLFAMTTVWSMYATVTQNWYIFVSNALGAVSSFVILCQFWIYRKKKEVQ